MGECATGPLIGWTSQSVAKTNLAVMTDDGEEDGVHAACTSTTSGFEAKGDALSLNSSALILFKPVL